MRDVREKIILVIFCVSLVLFVVMVAYDMSDSGGIIGRSGGGLRKVAVVEEIEP